jgi:hypothetical protein
LTRVGVLQLSPLLIDEVTNTSRWSRERSGPPVLAFVRTRYPPVVFDRLVMRRK